MTSHPERQLVSVVVPVRSRAPYWRLCLQSLAHQHRSDTCDMEILVVIVDNGAIDLAGGLVNNERVRIITPERTLAAAEARNMGAAHARGDVLLFNDDDVLCAPDTVHTHGRIHAHRPGVVCLGYVNGIELTPFDAQRRHPAFAFPGNDASALIRELSGDSAINDVRAAFSRPDSSVSRVMTLPWALCWTLNTSIRACSFVPFDESFETKGSEDLEWGYRLHKSKHEFWLGPQSQTCHIPHPRDRVVEMEVDRRNVRRFLTKWPDLAVEALAAFDCLHAEAMHTYMQKIAALDIEQPDAREIARGLQLTVDGPIERLLLIGFQAKANGCPGIATARIDARGEIVRTGIVLPLLGACLPYGDKEFDCAVVGSVSQILPEALLCRILQEALRVARHVLVYVPEVALDVQRVNAPERGVPRPYWCKRFYFSDELEDFAFCSSRTLRHGTLVSVQWARSMQGITFGHDAWCERKEAVTRCSEVRDGEG